MHKSHWAKVGNLSSSKGQQFSYCRDTTFVWSGTYGIPMSKSGSYFGREDSISGISLEQKKLILNKVHSGT
jgi:hypothetical protein